MSNLKTAVIPLREGELYSDQLIGKLSRIQSQLEQGYPFTEYLTPNETGQLINELSDYTITNKNHKTFMIELNNFHTRLFNLLQRVGQGTPENLKEHARSLIPMVDMIIEHIHGIILHQVEQQLFADVYMMLRKLILIQFNPLTPSK